MASEGERCAKPGCGALRVLGNPCTDWDCPQLFVAAAEHKSLLTRLAELEEALLNIDCAAAVSHNGTEAATITFILAETKRILDPSRAALDGEG